MRKSTAFFTALTLISSGTVMVLACLPHTDAQRTARIRIHLTDAQRAARIHQIAWAGVSPTLTDYVMMEQDVDRARAKYPNVSANNLLYSTSIYVDESNHIPCNLNSSGNSSCVESHGKYYLSGIQSEWFVKGKFPLRASSWETRTFLKNEQDKKRISASTRPSIFWGMSSTNYALSVDCSSPTCTVRESLPASSDTVAYSFPYAPAEWGDDPSTMKEIRALPSFAKAAVKTEMGNAKARFIIKEGN
ncbi:hypothetical protein [Acetobacter persici]|uniref:Uncharacterized protein n=1 Tax=Acetobacter persici TaxID=1076596 RepID=A0A1U9LJE0_9PROT|nr:hypothetical protein [Acetobacter persici]AQT06556.1 hypothetical protein A0U91_16240 [Acetobacter persici]